MTKHLAQDLQETRKNLFEFFAEFFIGPRTEKLLVNRKAAFESILQIAKVLEMDSSKFQYSEAEPDSLSIEQQFARLFYGVGKSTVSMQERSYRSSNLADNAKNLASLFDLHASAGLMINKDKQGEADSLGLELDFASGLVAMDRDTDLIERTLLNEHLFPLARCIRDQAKALEPNGPVIEVLDALILFLGIEIKLTAEPTE